MVEPRERLAFTLAQLAEGGNGLRSVVEWFALAPHLGTEIAVSSEEVTALGKISPSRWVESETAGIEPAVLYALIEKELVLAEGSAAAARDERLRDTHWHPASATMHYTSRWRNVDTEAAEREYAEVLRGDFLPCLGSPPSLVRERTAADRRRRLPAPEASMLDLLLGRRVTCRNFSRTCALTQAEFSAVLYRSYGARAVDEFAPGITLQKKGVPSAGGLHATEAYLLVQRVDGVAPGLYHYHPVDHALEPIRALDANEAAKLARRFVAAQGYFADAHVLVVPASRFRRNFWKYRNHAKAYRALILDVGHLSQTMYLAATELGLAAFVTAAINEADIEEAFGLDPLEEGALAVSGFGRRAAERGEVEFDPLHAVWPAAG
jgi:putative peptide maturation dehydrogenase